MNIQLSLSPETIGLLRRFVAAVERIAGPAEPAGLLLRFKEESAVKVHMHSQNSRAGAAKQAMPPVKWSTLAAGLQLVLIGDDGAPIGSVDASKLTSTLEFDRADLVATKPGDDALSYTATRAAGAVGSGTMTATVTYNDGSFGPFSSTLPIELDQPAPKQPTDLQIRITGN